MFKKKEVFIFTLLFGIMLIANCSFLSAIISLNMVITPSFSLSFDSVELPLGVNTTNVSSNYAGINNTAYFFSDNGYLTIKKSLLPGFNQNNFSLEAWFKIFDLSNNSETNGGYIFSSNQAFILRQNNNEGLSFFICNSSLVSCWGEDSRSSLVLSKNKWYHLVIVHSYNNITNITNLKTFINGNLTAEKDRNDIMREIGDSIILGQYFNGWIDEFNFYNKSINNTDIYQKYNQYEKPTVEVNTSLCFDSDEQDFNNKGYVKYFKDNNYTTINDSCQNNETLLERICRDNTLESIVYSCPQNLKCSDGACVIYKTVVITEECTTGENTCFDNKYSECVGSKWTDPVLAPGKCGYSEQTSEDEDIKQPVTQSGLKILLLVLLILILLAVAGIVIYFVFIKKNNTYTKPSGGKVQPTSTVKQSSTTVLSSFMPNNPAPQNQPQNPTRPVTGPVGNIPSQPNSNTNIQQPKRTNVLQRPYKK